MLTIRLSRHGRTKRPFYRIVLTEHSKPVKLWYQDVFGSYDPLAHKLIVDTNLVKEWVSKGAQLSERVAKLLYNETKDDAFKKFIVVRQSTKKSKKEEAVA